MAETHSFMTRSDLHAFLSFLIDLTSAEFVPEKSDHPPPFPRYATPEEVQARIDRDTHYSRFFVLSRRWKRFPLVFDEIHANDGRHFFTVCQRHGGPAFDFILSWLSTDRGVRSIASVSLSDYSYYLRDKSLLADRSLYETFDRPDEMTAAHDDVRKYLRRNGRRSVCRETGHTGPWLLAGVLQEYESGGWLRIGGRHFQPKDATRGGRGPGRRT